MKYFVYLVFVLFLIGIFSVSLIDMVFVDYNYFIIVLVINYFFFDIVELVDGLYGFDYEVIMEVFCWKGVEVIIVYVFWFWVV